ncbi:hypothetical protein [Nakamurella sp.]|uniref:hypothetical protein n=1 Tax=Nakamurella sp. TaxID=1869182 RepID=UPI003B3ACF5D
MQPQTLPDTTTPPAEPEHYTVTFDTLASELAPLTVAAPCSVQDLAEAIREHVEAAGYYYIRVDVDLPSGRATINDDGDGEFGGADITGPGVGQPDYWVSLAADVHAAADRIATLAGTSRQPARVVLDITVTRTDNTDLTAVALGERLAEAFAGGRLTAETVNLTSGSRVHQVRTRIGTLRVEADTYLPGEPGELERLRAENAELLARLGVAKTETVDPNRCPVCRHEAEHLIGAGCVARPSGRVCGCGNLPGGAR